MKRTKLLAVLLAVLTIVFTLTSCGTDSVTKEYNGVNYDEAETVKSSSASTSESEKADTSRKIIKYTTLNVQTKTFDDLIEKIEDQITVSGGYIENSSVDGNNFNYEGNRTAELVIRIPSSKSNSFTDFIESNGTVTNKQVSTEDVTLTYVDIESRISAIKAEKTALENLLKSAQNVSDIMEIQKRLTDVIADLESYESRLRTYDNLIDYTTVTLHIEEVDRTEVVEKQNIWQEIGTNLANNFEDVGHFFVRFFVGVVSAIPYLLIILAIAVIIAFILKNRSKKPKKEKNTDKGNNPFNSDQK